MKNILNIYLNQINEYDFNKMNELKDQEEIENKIYLLKLSKTNIIKQIEEIIKIENNYLLLNNVNIIIYTIQQNQQNQQNQQSINQIDENTKKLMIQYSYLKNINIFIIELFQELTEENNELLALFFIHSSTIINKMKYKIINNQQEKIINISNEYFHNDKIFSQLFNIFFVKSLKIY
jgi:hypothetical protein